MVYPARGRVRRAAGARTLVVPPAPVDGGPGTLTVQFGSQPAAEDHGFRMLNGSTYQWELGPAENDLVAVQGDLLLDAWTLEILDAGGSVADFGDRLDLFTYTGDLLACLGASTIDPSNLDLGPDPGQWQIDPVNGLAIDFEVDGAGLGHVYLTGLAGGTAAVQVIPEPSTFLLAALGLLGLGVMARRRRRAA